MDSTGLEEGGGKELTRGEPAGREIVISEAQSLSAQRFLRMLRRRRRLILAVAITITLAVLSFSLLREPVYEAEAVLLMSPAEPATAASGEEAASSRPDSNFVDSQVEILRSPALSLQLVDRLGLANDPQLGGAERDRLAAARAVNGAIRAERRGSTYVVEVAVRASDPGKATLLTNTLVELYFASRAVARQQAAAQTGEWISERLNLLRDEVQAREAEVEAYRAENGLLTVEGAMLAEQQMRDAEQSVVAARADLAEREARHRQVARLAQSGDSTDTMAGALNSAVMVQLRARQADLMARVADYSGRYSDRHPALQTARAELADIERQIEAEVARQARSLRNEADIARARAATVQSHLSNVRSALIGSNAQQVRLRELERNAAAARSVYENFLTRFHEVSDGVAGRGGDAQIVSEAMEPIAPLSRPWLMFAVLAAALGLFAGVLTAFLVEQFDTRVQSAEDVEEKAGAPMLTSIPTLRRADLARLSAPDRHPAGYVAAKPLSAFAEAIRVLRVRILHAGWSSKKVIAVTSALPGEGKTSVALSLARVCALSGQRVILVDCDLRRRSLNHLLGVDPDVGLVQVLHGNIPWHAAVGVDESSGAHILPAAQEACTAEDVCGSKAMKQLLDALAREHDLVILDCAPVLTLADVRHLASVADGVVMVARRGKTDASALQTALGELRAVRAAVLGVALNGVDIRAPGRSSYADPLYFSHATAGMYTL